MSFSDAELHAHCDEIITDPAIRNRIIVLCEGDTKPFKPTPKALNIGQFSQRTQDSAFYYRAIPEWWKNTRNPEPSFYVCGTQSNVIKAYFYLKQKHQQQPQNSYLNFNKLFTLIDIDLQKTKLPNDYSFKNLEDVYQDLYLNGKVNPDTANNHKIWVTGLLHKEAYFLIPEIKTLLRNYLPQPCFNNTAVDFDKLYPLIAQAMSNHVDIQENFAKAKQRIKYYSDLYKCESIDAFKNTWLAQFSNPELSIEQKQTLIYVLLTLAKSKPIWEAIKSTNDIDNHKNYRDELCFKIAREFYAKQPRTSPHHLPSFFNVLATHSG